MKSIIDLPSCVKLTATIVLQNRNIISGSKKELEYIKKAARIF
ncbi:MAG: hypothetical protein PHS79_05065 [Patescibacteria group bacterium]|nr:hypothetical protein [Patescibacteria group bacterium]